MHCEGAFEICDSRDHLLHATTRASRDATRLGIGLDPKTHAFLTAHQTEMNKKKCWTPEG